MGSRADLRATLPEDLQLPERYQLVRRIASGGMATVWCAEDGILGRRVAIKLLAERYAHDETAIRRFKREARVAARVSGHQNILTIFDVGEAAQSSEPDAPHRAFIVMEYLAGGTVADALRVKEVGGDQALQWIHETAAALDYAHAQGVIHRDIKPANLLLDCDRVVHVTDFGIARVASDETFTNTGLVLGTAAYISPEQALGRPTTAASDRYALAVTAFELLTAQRPFAAGQLTAQARQHVEDEPPAASLRNPELPRAIDAVLQRGMAKRPEDRWPTAGAFALALEHAFTPATALTPATRVAPLPARGRGPRTAPANPAPAPKPLITPGARRRSHGRSLALAALAAALFAVIVIATGRSGSSTPARRTATTHRATAIATAPKPRATTHAAAPPKPKPAVSAATAATPNPPEVTGTAAAATTPAPTADTLEAQGHSLMAAGNYPQAIPVLRQALAAAPHGSLTYAYALYDLGRSLRLAGNPSAAAQVLYRRLQIPNQTGTVRSELQAALLALGRHARGQDGPGHGHAHAGPGD